MTSRVLLALLALLFSLMVWSLSRAEPVTPVVADKFKMAVLPPWTVRACPVDEYATYDLKKAKQLVDADAVCQVYKVRSHVKAQQLQDAQAIIEKQKLAADQDAELKRLADKRIQDLVKQVKDEIAEKNKYKYAPDYRWLWIAGGAAVALTGIAFGAGVWVAKD